MATTGAPNQKYASSDNPDLVNGPYAEHTHNVSLNGSDIKDVSLGLTFMGITDNTGIARGGSGSDAKILGMSYASILYDYVEKKVAGSDFLTDSSGNFNWYFLITNGTLVRKVQLTSITPNKTPTKIFGSFSPVPGTEYMGFFDVSALPVYTDNLSNVTPVGIQTSALDSPKGIVSHDLHVVLTHYPPMAGDAGETEIVVPRLVGHIEVDGTLGGGGGVVSPNARYLQITFENFPTDATNYGSSNVAVVTSGSNPTYLGTCFVPMTLGSTLSNAVIVSLPTVGDSGTLESPTIYFS